MHFEIANRICLGEVETQPRVGLATSPAFLKNDGYLSTFRSISISLLDMILGLHDFGKLGSRNVWGRGVSALVSTWQGSLMQFLVSI